MFLLQTAEVKYSKLRYRLRRKRAKNENYTYINVLNAKKWFHFHNMLKRAGESAKLFREGRRTCVQIKVNHLECFNYTA